MFWYHDHAMGATRFNNYAGLAGAWLVRDAIEDALGLPTDESHELPLILQDRNLATADGSANGDLTGLLLHKVQTDVRECFGPATIVSGKLWPRLCVEPSVYRLRLLNGSNARYFRLHFFGITSTDDPVSYNKLTDAMIQQIGTDGGLLGAAINLPMNGLLLAPAERADVLIDFGLIASEFNHVVVFNDAPAPFGNEEVATTDPWMADTDNLRPVPHVMRFDLIDGELISGLNDTAIQGMSLDPAFRPLPSDHQQLPPHEHSLIVLREEDELIRDANGTPLDSQGNSAVDASGQLILDSSGLPIAATRTMLFLHEMMPEAEANRSGMNMYNTTDEFGAKQGIRLSLKESGGVEHYVTAAKRFHDATTIFIQKGAWHLWKILNLSPDSHPFHIHLTQLQAIERRIYLPTAGTPIDPGLCFDFDLTPGPPPDPGIPPGWKDTFRISPGERQGNNLIVNAEMTVLFGQFPQHAGRYMYHCHILEHEDSDMMRPFVVLPAGLMASMGSMGMS